MLNLYTYKRQPDETEHKMIKVHQQITWKFEIIKVVLLDWLISPMDVCLICSCRTVLGTLVHSLVELAFTLVTLFVRTPKPFAKFELRFPVAVAV